MQNPNDEPMERLYEKLDALLEKIPNGKEKYRESALMHKIVDSLIRGQEPIQLIDQLITMHETLRQEYGELISKIPPRFVINPFDINKP